MNRRRRWQWWWRGLALGLGTLATFGVGVFGLLTWGTCAVFGQNAQGARRARMEASPQWQDGRFENPQPLTNHLGRMIMGMFSASADGSPSQPLPVVAGEAARFAEPPPSGLRVTWFGHSSLLVEIDGHRILTDPVWGERASPLSLVGPKRWYAPPISLEELPVPDAVVISHDHYDHLDHPTITAIKGWNTTFVVPLGVGAHLAHWGIPESRIVELDWWQETEVRSLRIVCTPARHASGRRLVDNNATLWAGFALQGQRHRVFFSGDTGLFPGLRDIGARLGPFDLTLIEAGAYDPAWPDWHAGPEQAVRAHKMVGGRVLLPIHWGLFNLAYHGWTEPIERVLVAAEAAGVTVLAPRPGESLEPAHAGEPARWWPQLPWKTATDRPVVSTLVD